MHGIFRRLMKWAREPYVTCDDCWRPAAVVRYEFVPDGEMVVSRLHHYCEKHNPASLSDLSGLNTVMRGQ